MPNLPPDPGGIFDAVRRMGYGFPEAVADVVDNSIDASAMKIFVNFIITGHVVSAIEIADDGSGMNADQLDAAMTFGLRTGKNETALGKYGLGLKAASLSQSHALSVFSKAAGVANGRRWTEDGIRRGWECDELSSDVSMAAINRHAPELHRRRSGTVVRWESPSRFENLPADQVSAAIDDGVRSLLTHLGVVMHRFLQSERASIAIRVWEDTKQTGQWHVDAIDPFGYRVSGHKDYPRTLTCDLGDLGSLDLEAHIWPANSSAPGYRLGGGQVANRQGFYFYRNDRLIQHGGWNNWRHSSEPHLSLARVAINLPPSLDQSFELTTQKHGISPPPQFFAGLRGAGDGSADMPAYIATAESIYRAKPSKGRLGAAPCVPSNGLDQRLIAALESTLAPGGIADRITIKWRRLDDDQFFEISPDRTELVINTALRGKGTSAGAPVMTQLERMLLFLLLRDELTRQRESKQSAVWLQQCQGLLVEAANSNV